jgi:hypothetical protein
MLPSWLNDASTLVTLITGVPAILGWFIKRWIAEETQPTPTFPPTQRQRITLWGSIKTGISQLVIQPEIPVWNDTFRVIVATISLMGASALYLWNRGRPIQLQWDQSLRQIGFVVIFGLGILVTVLWARLFLKIDYLNRMK